MLATSAKLTMLSHRAFYLLLALVLQPCVGPCEQWNALDIQSKGEITRAPFQSNLQDMNWFVGAFKPRDLVTNEKLPATKGDKRLGFKGKGKGLNNFAILGGICGQGAFSLGSTISLASSKGLRDGQTSSWVYADYIDGLTTTTHQVSLQYHAALADVVGTSPGWIARAFINGVNMGEIEYPGESSIDARIVQYPDRTEFLTRPTPVNPYGGGAEGAFDLIFMNLHAPPDKFQVGLGAFGLDKGGKVFTDMLWLLGPDLGPVPGSNEVFAFNQFGNIGYCLKDAKSQISSPSPSLINVQGALSQVSNALNSAISTMFTLKDGVKNNLYTEAAAAKIAAKIGKQTYKKLHSIQNKLQNMLDKGKVNLGAIKSVCNNLESLIDRSAVGQANMLGVRAKNIKQLGTGYPIDPADVPDLL